MDTMMNTKHRIVRTSLGKWSARLAILAAGASVVGHAAPASAKLFELSEADEIKAGQQVAAQAQKEYGRALPAGDPMSRRVVAIGRKFAALSTRRNIPFSYTVLQNEKVLNAFAAPGGPIFVTTKLVRTTGNDAELAYVLGHETGHIEQRHIAKAMAKQQKVGIGAAILGAVLGNKGGGVAGTLINGTFAVWQSGYSRSQESEADAVGVRLMSRLGYDPRAALTMLHKLDVEGGGGGGGLDKYLSSHPAPAKRITAVSAQIQKENLIEAARQNGGPRLSDGGSYGNTSYSGGGYANAGDQYPDDYSNTGGSNTSGGTNSGSNGDYPDYNTGGSSVGTSSGGQVADLGGPLRIVERGDDSVILASAAGVARWAGATVRVNGNATTLSRNGRTLELRRNSTVAFLNGRRQDLSMAPSVVSGVLYAPLGDLVEGVGGTARYDEQLNAVRLQLDGRESIISLPRR